MKFVFLIPLRASGDRSTQHPRYLLFMNTKVSTASLMAFYRLLNKLTCYAGLSKGTPCILFRRNEQIYLDGQACPAHQSECRDSPTTERAILARVNLQGHSKRGPFRLAEILHRCAAAAFTSEKDRCRQSQNSESAAGGGGPVDWGS